MKESIRKIIIRERKGKNNDGNNLIALEITWKGMAGLFAAAALIWFCIWIMGKIGQKK